MYRLLEYTFKYHVAFTDGKISVRINLLFYLYFPPSLTVNCPSQETEVTSTPRRLVENVVITTKGLFKTVIWKDGGK